jgi:hypothetical protein
VAQVLTPKQRAQSKAPRAVWAPADVLAEVSDGAKEYAGHVGLATPQRQAMLAQNRRQARFFQGGQLARRAGAYCAVPACAAAHYQLNQMAQRSPQGVLACVLREVEVAPHFQSAPAHFLPPPR